MSILPLAAALALAADHYAPPAGTRAAIRRPGAQSILPGGRIIEPWGRQYPTGPGPFGLAVSPSGRLVASANGGPERCSLTVMEREGSFWQTRHLVAASKEGETTEGHWRSVSMGVAFGDDRTLYVSEGNSGRVRAMDPRTGDSKRIYPLDEGGYRESYSGDLAFDRHRGLLFVLDQANFRLVVIDTRRHRVLGSVRVGRLPFCLALAPDGRKAWVANVGMFEYRVIPGGNRADPRGTGLPFPAFGFPSPEAFAGARRQTTQGFVDVPGLGDPNAPESNSVAVVNLEDPAAPRVEAFLRTGLPFGEESLGGSSPSGIACGAGLVFVSNAHNDSITVLDAASHRVRATIPIRVPGLEKLRGVLPVGLAYHESSGWLLVAEAGINAVGVIDTRTMEVLGHIPAAWLPTRVVLHGDTVFVTSARGLGTGPNHDRKALGTFHGLLRRGTISVYPLPGADELRHATRRVLEHNGFVARKSPPAALPPQIRYVVLIVKGNRTFDEVLGDIERAQNGPVAGSRALARLGRWGEVVSGRRTAGTRLLLRNVNITPNHHSLAERFAFSDNFYADSEGSACGHRWLAGAYPNAWAVSSLMAAYAGHKDFRLSKIAPGRLAFVQASTALHPEDQPEAGTLWHHLERHGVSFRSYGGGLELAGAFVQASFKPSGARYLTNVPLPEPLYRNTSREYPLANTNIPDQHRADRFIAEVRELFLSGDRPFPRFLYVHLPNDRLAPPRPEDGYPYEASYAADNDYALGRIVEFLSRTPHWREMAIFVTEEAAEGGVDHIDSHRTILLVVSPYARRNYVSRVNSSFPGLLKTIFRLLGLPPLNLFDATAADLADCFTDEPDFTPYTTVPVDPRIFDPTQAREPLDSPSPSGTADPHPTGQHRLRRRAGP
ncbi:MAG: alkaline phosphatase family protein [Bryobacterales bacterium]|nr:hypothetical protein [Bryobacteraceae bacterium]MDW8129968.1 alkaline phosphatase family protein [Bryobacterales bacterium]